MHNQLNRPVIIDSTVAAFLTRYQQAMQMAETESEKSLINAFAQNFIYIYGGAKANDAVAASVKAGTRWASARSAAGAQDQLNYGRAVADVEVESRFFMFDALLHQLDQARSERKATDRTLREKDKLVALGRNGIARANRLTEKLDSIFNRVPDLFKSEITEEDYMFLRTASAFNTDTAGFSLREILDSVEKSKGPFRILPESGNVGGVKQEAKHGVALFIHDLANNTKSANAVDNVFAKMTNIAYKGVLYYHPNQESQGMVSRVIDEKLKHYPEPNPHVHIIMSPDEASDRNVKTIEEIERKLTEGGHKPVFDLFSVTALSETESGVWERIQGAIDEVMANRADIVMDTTAVFATLETPSSAGEKLSTVTAGAADERLFNINDPLRENETNPVVLWAHIHRLRAEVKGPNGYETWQHHSAMMHDRAHAAEVKVYELEQRLREAHTGYALENVLRNEMNELFDEIGRIRHLPTIQGEKMGQATTRYMQTLLNYMDDKALAVTTAPGYTGAPYKRVWPVDMWPEAPAVAPTPEREANVSVEQFMENTQSLQEKVFLTVNAYLGTLPPAEAEQLRRTLDDGVALAEVAGRFSDETYLLGTNATAALVAVPSTAEDGVAHANAPICMCQPPNNRHPASYLGAICPGCSQVIQLPPTDALEPLVWAPIPGAAPAEMHPVLKASITEIGNYSTKPKS